MCEVTPPQRTASRKASRTRGSSKSFGSGREERSWMAGNNNLDEAALRDIEEMTKTGSTRDVNCLVQLDWIEDKLT